MTIVIPYYRSKPESVFNLVVDLAIKNIGPDVVVIGDNPKRDDVEWIRLPRISAGEYQRRYGRPIKHRKAVDAICKLLAAIESPRVSGEFVRLYDDTFVTRPVTIEELKLYRYRGRVQPSDKKIKGYLELRRKTFCRLRDAGLTTYDFGNHLPIVFQKSKLKETIEQFDLLHDPGLIEIVYQNSWPAEQVKFSSRWFRFVSCTNDLPEGELPPIVTAHNNSAERVATQICSRQGLVNKA